MNKKIFFMVVVFFATLMANAQTNSLIIGKNIRLPKDSIQSALLIANLNDFLIAAQKPNEENQFVPAAEKLETYVLLDEFKDISKSAAQQDDNFFKPHLTNVVAIDEKQYLIQLSFIGAKDDIPTLRASFELIAHKDKDSYLFSSPLLYNTKDWKTTETENCIFYYQDRINREQAENYAKAVAAFDEKLQSPVTVTKVYVCGNFVDLGKLTGMDYKLDYNSYSTSSTSAVSDNKMLIVWGMNDPAFEAFDPHDLFHSRANIAVPADKRNHHMVCGCAYIHGGSWGMSFEEIQKIFKSKVPYDKNTDWLKLYFDSYNYGSREKDLTVTQFVNALITRKIEKEQGFSAVVELLSSGNMYKEKENFFKILEKVTGINEKNFNKEVGKLINEAMK